MKLISSSKKAIVKSWKVSATLEISWPGKLLFLFVLAVCISSKGFSQIKRIAVIGSSTSTGYGLPSYISGNTSSAPDSWVNKLKRYYKDKNIIDTIYNIAQASTDCYVGMPTGYTPPAGRSAPNPNLNITKALSFNPKPNVIIVNYPSNSYDWLSIQEIMFCLRTIYKTAKDGGVDCFITATQPRNTFSPSEREKLRIIKDSILTEFGDHSIDFWADIVQTTNLTIRPEYSLGDGIHLNVAGHDVLYKKAVQRNVFGTASISLPTPSKFKYMNASRIDSNTLQIEFEMEEASNAHQYFVNLTIDGLKKRLPLQLPEKPVANKKYYVTVKIN